MATTDLSIHKAAYDLAVFANNVTANYRKEYKFTIGSKLVDYTLRVLMYIHHANNDKSKRVGVLDNMLMLLEEITILFRISKDLKLINVEKLAKSIELIDNIKRQAIGWKNHQIRQAA